MKFIKNLLTTKYLVEINYKSGIKKRLWFYYFQFTTVGPSITITYLTVRQKILFLGVDYIESCYVVRTKKRFFNRKP